MKPSTGRIEVHSVAVTRGRDLLFLGHHIEGQPCPWCAEASGALLQMSHCATPERCSERTAEKYRDGTATVNIIRNTFRIKMGRAVYRKADASVRIELGLQGV